MTHKSLDFYGLYFFSNNNMGFWIYSQKLLPQGKTDTIMGFIQKYESGFEIDEGSIGEKITAG